MDKDSSSIESEEGEIKEAQNYDINNNQVLLRVEEESPNKKRMRCDDCVEKISKKKKNTLKNSKPRDNTLNEVVQYIKDVYNDAMYETPIRAFKNIPMHQLKFIFNMSKWNDIPNLYTNLVCKYIKQNVKAMTTSTTRVPVWVTDETGDVLKDGDGNPMPAYVEDAKTGKNKIDKKTGKPIQRRRVTNCTNGRTINIAPTGDDISLAELWIHKNLYNPKNKHGLFAVTDVSLVAFNNLGEDIKNEVLNLCGSLGIKDNSYDRLKNCLYIPGILNPKQNDRATMDRYGLRFQVSNN